MGAIRSARPSWPSIDVRKSSLCWRCRESENITTYYIIFFEFKHRHRHYKFFAFLLFSLSFPFLRFFPDVSLFGQTILFYFTRHHTLFALEIRKASHALKSVVWRWKKQAARKFFPFFAARDPYLTAAPRLFKYFALHTRTPQKRVDKYNNKDDKKNNSMSSEINRIYYSWNSPIG